MKTVAIVLTLNEAKHLGRCLDSIRGVVDDVVVVDCYSSDKTVEIARHHGAHILQNPWVNHATQFNWALTQIEPTSQWILRIDADEYLTPDLAKEIASKLPAINPSIDGVYLRRRMTFQGKLIRHGGVFPLRVLRLFRYGRGHCEERWMDEHIKVEGPTIEFNGEVIDDNLNTLTWWTAKHNDYASREAIDLLNLEYAFMRQDSLCALRRGSGPAVKRWLKEHVYAPMPGGARAFGYFFYRYVLRLGFLDGGAGSFHVLQALWYRFLVDAKVSEVKRYIRASGCAPATAIQHILGIDVLLHGSRSSPSKLT